MLEDLKLREFSGEIQNYPHWKRYWQEVMHPRMDVARELFELPTCVPAEVKNEVEMLEDLDEVWKVLDEEYASKDVRRSFTVQ